MDYRVLNISVDGLEVAFKGSLPKSVLDAMTEEKARAESEGEAVYCNIRGLPGEILPNGAKGGYRFIFRQGDFAPKWQVKYSTDPTQWNLFCRVPATACLEYGFRGVIRRIYDDLEAFGAQIMESAVSRFDACCDLYMPELQSLDPANITAHYQTDIKRYSESDAGDEILVVGGNKVTGVTIGNMPNRQIAIYDKRREVIRKRNMHWFEQWGIDPRDKTPVWRVEVRAGKDYLRDFNIHTINDLMAAAGDMVEKAMNEVRYLAERHSSNVTYSRVHTLWDAAREAIGRLVMFNSCGAKRGRVIDAVKSEKARQLLTQTMGLMRSVAWFHKAPAVKFLKTRTTQCKDFATDEQRRDYIFDRVMSHVRGAIWNEYERDKEEFFEKMDAIGTRYFWLDNERVDYGDLQHA